MNIAIFTAGTPSAVLLAHAATSLGHTVRMGLFESEAERQWLVAADVCIVRMSNATFERASEIALFYQQQNPTGMLSTSYDGIRTSGDKFLAYQRLQSAHIPTPQTWLIENMSDIESHQLAQKLPVIIKPRSENRGTGVTLIRTKDELIQFVGQLLGTYGSCIAQEFVAEAQGRDIRAFVVGDRVVAAMERTAPKGSAVANLALGGTARLITLDQSATELAIRATQEFESEYCGVDLLQGPDGYVVIEINISPGFKVAEVAGIDIRTEVIKHLTRKGHI